MGKIDDLYADIHVRGMSQATGLIGAFRNMWGGLKSTTAGGIAIGGAGMFARSNISEMKSLIGAGGITALIGAGTVKAAADLEQARAGLKRFVEEDFGALSVGIEKLSLKIPIAVSGLYDIASGAAQVGVEGTANILAFTEVVGKLASVSSMSFNETAKDLAKLHNVFGLKPQASFRTANVIAGLSAASAADPGELITTTRYLSGAASTIKFTLDQTLALSAAIKDAGISSEVGGTAFNKLILDMAKMPAEFAKITGMTTSDFKKLRDTNPMQALLKSLKSIESETNIEDKMGKAEAIGVESTRQSGALLQLIKAIELFEEHLHRATKFGEEKTVLDKQFGKTAETTYASLTKVGNAFMLVSDLLGGPVARKLGEAAEGITQAVTSFKEAETKVKEPPLPVGPLNQGGQRAQAGAIGALPAFGGQFPPDKGGKTIKQLQEEEAQKQADAAAKDTKATEEGLAVKKEEVERRTKLISTIDLEISSLLESAKNGMKMVKADRARGAEQSAVRMEGAIDDVLKIVATKQGIRGLAVDLLKKSEVAVAGDQAKLKAARDKEEAKKSEAGFVIKEGGRKFAFDKMVDPTGFAQFESAFRGLPKELLGTDAGKAISGKLGAMVGADVKKNLTEDELTQLIAKRQGAVANIAQAVAQERVQRLYARATFSSSDETWKRIASGAAEGSGVEKYIKQSTQMQRETKEATKAVEAELKSMHAEIKDNMVVFVGGP